MLIWVGMTFVNVLLALGSDSGPPLNAGLALVFGGVALFHYRELDRIDAAVARRREANDE
jgi:hypothetical protein